MDWPPAHRKRNNALSRDNLFDAVDQYHCWAAESGFLTNRTGATKRYPAGISGLDAFLLLDQGMS